MKAKKFLMLLLLFALVVTCLAGCTPKTEYDDKVEEFVPKTEYDDKQVAKIETRLYNGEGLVGYRVRLFDFETGTVTDEAVVSDHEFDYLLRLYTNEPSGYPEYENTDEYRDYLLANYNVSVKVAEFSQDACNGFISTAKSFGIYTWQESYVDNFVCDATSQYIIITFADGTTKTTHCYCKYPEDFEKVEGAFKDYFGVDAWCKLRLR